MTKTLADNIIEDLDLITWIKARGFYNPVLKVASFGNDACKKVFEYLCSYTGDDNRRLREINLKTIPISKNILFKRIELKMRGYQII